MSATVSNNWIVLQEAVLALTTAHATSLLMSEESQALNTIVEALDTLDPKWIDAAVTRENIASQQAIDNILREYHEDMQAQAEDEAFGKSDQYADDDYYIEDLDERDDLEDWDWK